MDEDDDEAGDIGTIGLGTLLWDLATWMQRAEHRTSLSIEEDQLFYAEGRYLRERAEAAAGEIGYRFPTPVR